MKILHITVSDKIASYNTRDGVVVCGNSDYSVQFAFDAEWDEHAVKTARFRYNDRVVDIPFEGDTVAVPKLRNTYLLTVGVYAGDLRTTTAAKIPCEKSILCDDGLPPDPEPDVYAQIMKLLDEGGGGTVVDPTIMRPKIAMISLPASGWVGADGLYSQIVEVEGATENSQVDLTPSIEQLAIFHEKDLAFVTENEDGVVTVYALGDKPQNDYTMQVTITEVNA